MAKDVQITVSLDTEADPPVVVCPPNLLLRGKRKFKVYWEKAKHTEDFKIESLEIGNSVFPNPTSGGTPGTGSPLSMIKVEDHKAELKDDVDTAADFEYTLTVESGGQRYTTTASTGPKLDGRRPIIRNEP